MVPPSIYCTTQSDPMFVTDYGEVVVTVTNDHSAANYGIPSTNHCIDTPFSFNSDLSCLSCKSIV